MSVSVTLSLFAMERRFARQEKLRLDYCSFMKTYQELGHMERIPESEIVSTSGNTFYLPHNAVVTNKLRVVFDGPHKDASGASLNEMLHIGPPLQRNLINVCLRFRVHQYVFCADIVKMFRQIWVDKKHRDYQRIVWRENPNEPIGHYRLCTVTYGTSPAPFLSMRVLKQLALDYKDRFPIASHSILHDFYVDDIMTGSDSVSGFSDASQKAYSAAVYIRIVSERGEIEVQLVAGKTHVAPVKQLTIPRLELCGALLLTRLIVLAWLSSPPRRWNTFISNRTAEILDELPRSEWNYIRSEQNPADCASRGVEPRNLLQLGIWWKGPDWLCMEFDSWPISAVSEEIEEVPEMRKQTVVAHVLCVQEGLLDKLGKRVSSWFKVLRVVAVFVRRARNNHLPPEERMRGFLRSSELLYAKQKCLLWAQEEFSEEIQSLKTGKCISSRSKLSSLSPFLDDVGLLRVGGRISNAVDVSYSLKHPIILPEGHAVSRLIIQDAHTKFLHAGVSELFSLKRQEFWIFGSRNHIRKVVRECLGCFRQRQATSSQLMGNLPSSRLSPSFAFDRTGCDYAGPITLRLAKGRNTGFVKGYFALFVCMVTKALHLEVVSDLSTDAFLAALRRFVARRGKCSIIYSDNGTNFQGAARTLCEWYNLVRSEEHNHKISSKLAADGIKWEFIPPHSPHFGGLWEAGVKSVKQHLRRIVGNNVLTFEEISTLLSQIKALLNSRPLCAISDTDLNPLTPSHFLIGRPYTAIPEPSCLEIPQNRLGRWQLIQNMMQGFWRRWHYEYLTSLQERAKWQKKTPNFKVGDLVVIKEPNIPPSRWALGRILVLHPGEDDLVRVVSLRTKNGIFKRPITKLAILPCS
ncbi:uncharacterized protein LOC129921565 [Episyrphus balteatus]|uniref:uncharacterized protein LOC129921565 n=1 Tax=Episyrphus balteatus TaxID=286459 RepID=UPI002485C965|nr:uncharacterized protein LOC129921565 [Episyrphus balteatus]